MGSSASKKWIGKLLLMPPSDIAWRTTPPSTRSWRDHNGTVDSRIGKLRLSRAATMIGSLEPGIGRTLRSCPGASGTGSPPAELTIASTTVSGNSLRISSGSKR